MKKTIITIMAGAFLLFASCKKEETPEPKHIAAFGGVLTANGHVYINGEEKSLEVVYDVKVGDVLRYVDTGEDWNSTGLTEIGSNEPPVITTHQGETEGYIIVDGVIAQQYQGNGDCNLVYKVK